MKTIPSLPVYWLPNYHVFWYNKTIKNNGREMYEDGCRLKCSVSIDPALPCCPFGLYCPGFADSDPHSFFDKAAVVCLSEAPAYRCVQLCCADDPFC